MRNYSATYAICIFISLYAVISIYQPSFLFNPDGSLREFGVGFNNTTILPLWLLSIILGILSLLIALAYTTTFES